MGKGSQPEAPAPPDYAAANREGIYADIETLPIRRLLDYATRSGTAVTYKDPKTGSDITADFTGKGDIDLSRLQTQLRGETADLEAANQLGIAQKYGADFQQVALDALKRQDPAGYAGRQELAAGLRSDYATPTNVSESERSQLLRDAAIGQSLERRGGQGGPTTLSQLANLTALGQAGDGQGTSAETELSRLVRSAGIGLAGQGDDYGLAGSAGSQQARNEALQAGIGEYRRGGEQQRETELSRLVRSAGIGLAGQGDDYGLAGSAASQQARNLALQRGIAEYSLGGQLSGEQQREIEQSVRGASAARGQALSTSGAIKEVLGKYNMGEQLKQQRLQNLLNVGSQVFSQEQAAGQSRAQLDQARLASLFGAQQAEYGQQQSSRGMASQESQQRLQNLLNVGAQAFGQEQAAGQSQAQLAQTRLASLFGAQQAEYGQQQASRGMTNQEVQQRLQNLFGAQQTEFGQSQSTRATGEQEAQQRLQNLFAAQQNQFGQETQLRQETQQQQQRRLSNLQSYVLGAPISSSFQSLQGAQQGAAPYTPIMAQGIGQNANAGQQAAGFAGNIFGTQAQLYNTQMANSGSPFADIAGSVLGAAAGSAFGAGGMFGKAK